MFDQNSFLDLFFRFELIKSFYLNEKRLNILLLNLSCFNFSLPF